MSVDYRVIDTSNRAALDALDIPSYDHVLVLGYSDHMAPQPADTRTLVTLLQLRKIAEHAGRHISVVSEMIDVRNRELAEVTRADDFVVSNKLVSLMLAQASENEYHGRDLRRPARRGRLGNLHASGQRLCRHLDRPVTFYTIASPPCGAARSPSATAASATRTPTSAAWRRHRQSVKSEKLLYSAADRVIVLAKD
jgi:hypothetical protein